MMRSAEFRRGVAACVRVLERVAVELDARPLLDDVELLAANPAKRRTLGELFRFVAAEMGDLGKDESAEKPQGETPAG